MNTIALDTNIAIDVLNGKPQVIDLMRQKGDYLLTGHGLWRVAFGAKNSGNRIKNESKYRTFIESCIVLDTNTLVAEAYAEIRLALKQKGKPIPENDIWIAAICVVNDIALLSHDKHFENIEGLQLIKIE